MQPVGRVLVSIALRQPSAATLFSTFVHLRAWSYVSMWWIVTYTERTRKRTADIHFHLSGNCKSVVVGNGRKRNGGAVDEQRRMRTLQPLQFDASDEVDYWYSANFRLDEAIKSEVADFLGPPRTNGTAISGIVPKVLELSDTEPASLNFFNYFPPASCVTPFLPGWLFLNHLLPVVPPPPPPSPITATQETVRSTASISHTQDNVRWRHVIRTKENWKRCTYAKLPTAFFTVYCTYLRCVHRFMALIKMEFVVSQCSRKSWLSHNS
jgi:hypothetical protein